MLYLLFSIGRYGANFWPLTGSFFGKTGQGGAFPGLSKFDPCAHMMLDSTSQLSPFVLARDKSSQDLRTRWKLIYSHFSRIMTKEPSSEKWKLFIFLLCKSVFRDESSLLATFDMNPGRTRTVVQTSEQPHTRFWFWCAVRTPHSMDILRCAGDRTRTHTRTISIIHKNLKSANQRKIQWVSAGWCFLHDI